jgi:Rieske Fe-S protein
MNRKEFICKYSIGCAAAMLPVSILLEGCSGPKYITAPIEGDQMVVPLTSFQSLKDNTTTYLKYVIVENDTLQFPICVYRMSESEYHALWMKCTHQGTELHVFGDRLQCPAHGSEFTTAGAVQNGPAAEPLRTFPITLNDSQIRISLR